VNGTTSVEAGARYVTMWAIGVRDDEHMDFRRPVEALIPGSTGRILAALGRVEAELPVSTLARLAGVGRTRASGIIGELADLGVVKRHEVGRTVLVSVARDNAGGRLIDQLANLRTVVIDQLGRLAAEIDPQPSSLSVFGSFARGDADRSSDIDILAVRPTVADDDRWASTLSSFARRARSLTGNRVDVVEYDLDELRRKTTAKNARIGREFWASVRRDAGRGRLGGAIGDFRWLLAEGAAGRSRPPMPAPTCPRPTAGWKPPPRAWKPVAGTWPPAPRWAAGINACNAISGALVGQRAVQHDQAAPLLETRRRPRTLRIFTADHSQLSGRCSWARKRLGVNRALISHGQDTAEPSRVLRHPRSGPLSDPGPSDGYARGGRGSGLEWAALGYPAPELCPCRHARERGRGSHLSHLQIIRGRIDRAMGDRPSLLPPRLGNQRRWHDLERGHRLGGGRRAHLRQLLRPGAPEAGGSRGRYDSLLPSTLNRAIKPLTTPPVVTAVRMVLFAPTQGGLNPHGLPSRQLTVAAAASGKLRRRRSSHTDIEYSA